ncbi:MAG: HAD hydrolase family protein [Candidatus Bipolaricaulota bacterium]|nr:HAD hydrolase family protein [Candidatus Bipolaricaulota bacterium]
MARVQFVTDLEGPLTLNDNAFEIAAHFLPDGARFFALISKYDDVLADILKRPGYRAGGTLTLIVPFLLAFGLCDRDLTEFSRKRIKPVPSAPEALQRILSQMPAFIISTSYEPYVRAVCEMFRFPCENAYGTKISLDAHELPQRERQELHALYSQILKKSGVWDQKSELSGELVAYLDEVFWEKIAQMGVGRVLREIQPVGGPEKARALRDVAQRTQISLAQTIYVGDSITDVEALESVRREGGLAVAFNGNSYALRAAELGCISSDALILAEIAEAFAQGGRERVLTLTLPRRPDLLTTQIDDAFIAKSGQMRRRLRGEAIGSLG